MSLDCVLDACSLIAFLNDEDGGQTAERVREKILDLPIDVVTGLGKQVFREAGRLKATYAVSLADSIALAEAKTRGMPLATCDHHEFDKLEQKGELSFFWIR